LGGLIEDDDVESVVGWQELADGERTHHEARLEKGYDVARLCQKLPDRHVPGLLLRLVVQDRGLTDVGPGTPIVASLDHRPVRILDECPIQLPELGDQPVPPH